MPSVEGVDISALPGGMDPNGQSARRRLERPDWRIGYTDGIEGKQKRSQSDSLLRHYEDYDIGYREGLEERGQIKLEELRVRLNGAEKDEVNHPSHYTQGTIEVWDFIVDLDLDYLRGNVIKYVSRAGKKDPEKELQDLEKAQAYLNKAIEVYKEMNSDPIEERSTPSS